MSRTIPNPADDFDGRTIPPTGPRPMGPTSPADTTHPSVQEYLTQILLAQMTMHSSTGTDSQTRPTYLEPGGMWLAPQGDGGYIVYQYQQVTDGDGTTEDRDVEVWQIDAAGVVVTPGAELATSLNPGAAAQIVPDTAGRTPNAILGAWDDGEVLEQQWFSPGVIGGGSNISFEDTLIAISGTVTLQPGFYEIAVVGGGGGGGGSCMASAISLCSPGGGGGSGALVKVYKNITSAITANYIIGSGGAAGSMYYHAGAANAAAGGGRGGGYSNIKFSDGSSIGAGGGSGGGGGAAANNNPNADALSLYAPGGGGGGGVIGDAPGINGANGFYQTAYWFGGLGGGKGLGGSGKSGDSTADIYSLSNTLENGRGIPGVSVGGNHGLFGALLQQTPGVINLSMVYPKGGKIPFTGMALTTLGSGGDGAYRIAGVTFAPPTAGQSGGILIRKWIIS